MLQNKKIAFIGLGKIGGALVGSLVNSGVVDSQRLVATTAHEESAKAASERFGIRVDTDNTKAIEDADIIVLAVKPQTMGAVLDEVSINLKPDQLLITLSAAISTNFVEKHLGQKSSVSSPAVVRAMPNTPCLVGQGMTVICPGEFATKEHSEAAKAIFSAVGLVELVDNEDLMDAVTALSGSGPAYAYIIIESLAEGGVKVGLPRDLATKLATQTLLGASAMVLETGEHPAKLKDNVTTPAGTTVDGIMELEDGGLRVALIKAVGKATEKSKELSQ